MWQAGCSHARQGWAGQGGKVRSRGSAPMAVLASTAAGNVPQYWPSSSGSDRLSGSARNSGCCCPWPSQHPSPNHQHHH